MLQADNVSKAEAHIKAMEGLYKQAYDSAVAYEQERKADQEARQQKQDKQQGSEASTSGKDAAADGQQPAMTISSHARIMYGNQLYEWSQMLAAVGKEWRPVLDEAVKCFKEAGCNEADIRGALKNHTQVGTAGNRLRCSAVHTLFVHVLQVPGLDDVSYMYCMSLCTDSEPGGG